LKPSSKFISKNLFFFSI